MKTNKEIFDSINKFIKKQRKSNPYNPIVIGVSVEDLFKYRRELFDIQYKNVYWNVPQRGRPEFFKYYNYFQVYEEIDEKTLLIGISILSDDSIVLVNQDKIDSFIKTIIFKTNIPAMEYVINIKKLNDIK